MHRQMSKRAVRRLLEDLDSEGCAATVCISAQTRDARDYLQKHLLPESEPYKSRAAGALADIGQEEDIERESEMAATRYDYWMNGATG